MLNIIEICMNCIKGNIIFYCSYYRLLYIIFPRYFFQTTKNDGVMRDYQITVSRLRLFYNF